MSSAELHLNTLQGKWIWWEFIHDFKILIKSSKEEYAKEVTLEYGYVRQLQLRCHLDQTITSVLWAVCRVRVVQVFVVYCE